MTGDDTAEEIFDVCDADDRVIGQAPRSQVHARGLLHRAVHIFVFRHDGRLLVHRRSATKDEYPHCYTSSASGHVEAGEDYEPAAVRELEEELGLTSPLQYLAKFPGGPETANEHSVLFRTVTDAEPTPDPGEIESIEYLTLADVAARLERHPGEFTPCFRVLFSWYHDQVT
ncbi:MAG: NUDIX domain-containing protein [Maioricimonas sp. JB049]